VRAEACGFSGDGVDLVEAGVAGRRAVSGLEAGGFDDACAEGVMTARDYEGLAAAEGRAENGGSIRHGQKSSY
jgi:hypothetical protein